MFNILVKYDGTAWETDQLMRMPVERLGEYSGVEADHISGRDPSTLKALVGIDTLLMYEQYSEGSNVDLVRYGNLTDIKVRGRELVFKFEEQGQFTRSV